MPPPAGERCPLIPFFSSLPPPPPACRGSGRCACGVLPATAVRGGAAGHCAGMGTVINALWDVHNSMHIDSPAPRHWGNKGPPRKTSFLPLPPSPVRGGTQYWSVVLTATSSPTTPTSTHRAAAFTSSPVGPPPSHTYRAAACTSSPFIPPFPLTPPFRSHHGWQDYISEAGGWGAPAQGCTAS